MASLTILDSDAPDGDGRLGREYSRTEAMMELVELYEQSAHRSLRYLRTKSTRLTLSDN